MSPTLLGDTAVIRRSPAPEPALVDDGPSDPVLLAERLQPDLQPVAPTADHLVSDGADHASDEPDAPLAAADAILFGLLERLPIAAAENSAVPSEPVRSEETAPTSVVIQTLSVEIVEDRRADREGPTPSREPRATGLLASSRWSGTTWGW